MFRRDCLLSQKGKAVGPDDIPVEVWKCLGDIALEFLTKTVQDNDGSERMPEVWRDSVLIPIFKNKGDVQSCSNYRGIQLISHTMKLCERVVERRLRSDLTFREQQYGFMPGKSTTDALFALRVLMEKYRDGWRRISGVVCDRRVPARVKGKVYRVAVRPAMLYGLETVALTKIQEAELEVAELKMLRFALGVTRMDKIRNEYIRGTAHVGRFGEKTREARLRWYGHVRRKKDVYIGRRMLRMELPEKRKQGRSKGGLWMW